MRIIEFKVKAEDHVVGDLLEILQEALKEGRACDVTISVKEASD